MSQINEEITSVPVHAGSEAEPCFAVVFEDVTNKVLWVGGPYSNPACANREAERQALILKYNGMYP